MIMRTGGHSPDIILTLYAYDAGMRHLLHRAKITGDLRAYELCLQLVTSQRLAKEWGRWADIIMPVPASLWGRVRGRFDVATGMAYSLAKMVDRPMVRAPHPLHWRMRKHAMLARIDRWQDRHLRRCNAAELNQPAITRVLLVDDVITTGESVNRVRRYLPKEWEVVALLCADARHI